MRTCWRAVGLWSTPVTSQRLGEVIGDRAVATAHVEDALHTLGDHLLEHPRAVAVLRIIREMAPHRRLLEPVAHGAEHRQPLAHQPLVPRVEPVSGT